MLCADHATAFDSRAAQDERVRQEEAGKQLSSLIDEWELLAAEVLAAVEHPTERLVRAVAEIQTADTRVLQEMIPDRWEDQPIARWFLTRVQSPATALLIHEKGLFGGGKSRRRPGWPVFRGSRAIKKFPHGESEHGTISVLEDGRIYYDRSFDPDPDDGFSVEGLQRIIEILELPPLSLPPRPGAPVPFGQ